MLAKLGDEPFDDKDWLFEVKYDGYRALAQCDGEGNVELYSRNLLSFNNTFSPIYEELTNIGYHCLLDGEVVVEDAKGRSHFQLLQNYQRTGSGQLKYYVFDILELEDKDLTGLSLIERKELLQLLLQKSKLKNIIYSDHIMERGVKFFSEANKRKLEGIIAKNIESPYLPGARSPNWLKIKITQAEEAIIAGYTHPRGSRNHFGALLLGINDAKGNLKYIGHCGTGFNEKTLKELFQKFQPLLTDSSPFSEKIKVNAPVQWLKPKLVCQVKFTEMTSDGIMRHPVYLGLRIDKSAKEVQDIKTQPMKTKAAKKKSAEDSDDSKNKELKVGKVVLKLTNLSKIYWPDDKITKGDLINYYDEMATTILPYLKDRPQSLNRFPNGINQPSFYQKDFDTDKIPDWLKTEKIFSESNNEYIDYLVCNDKATLLYMANLGCIEINPWNSRLQKPDNPDWMVIDLDPEDISFKEVVKAAQVTKKVFDEAEVDCYCKTSGATGLHIFVPLAGKYNYEVVKNFAQLIATHVNDLHPETTSILRMPSKRKKKVYLDFLQNRRGQTLAAPYSVRPRPGATVSTPLEWSEVNTKLDPKKFTIYNIFDRLAKKGDLWKPVIGKAANLEHAVNLIYKGGK